MAFAPPAAAATPRVLAIHFDADVNPVTQNYVCHQLKQAANQHYDAAVIVLNTPGGLLTSKDKIVLCELSAKLPVLVCLVVLFCVMATCEALGQNLTVNPPNPTIHVGQTQQFTTPDVSNSASVEAGDDGLLQSRLASLIGSDDQVHGGTEAQVHPL